MWSHYANSHKGFAIGFDKFELFNTIKGVFGKINYDDKFPVIPMFDEHPRHMATLIMTKSKHWTYEDEYRIAKSNAPREIFKLPETAIKEIVFGCKIDTSSRSEIIELAKKRKQRINLFDCALNKKEFKVDRVEIEY